VLKFILLALFVVAVVWLLRGARRSGKPSEKADEPTVMVVCEHCGVHLPRGEALTGPDGVFCSEAHRAAGRVPR